MLQSQVTEVTNVKDNLINDLQLKLEETEKKYQVRIYVLKSFIHLQGKCPSNVTL